VDWASKIKELRSKLLMTQSELSIILCVSYSTINRWEKGHHEPTMKQKRRLRELFSENNIRMED